MKLAGSLLLLSGWIVVIAAIVLLGNAARTEFVVAGLVVEALGTGLVFHAHLLRGGERG
ncbi:MAG TPA: hypothetical protein VM912_05075 [Terriglobales bacterium]|nr:hypothetical protein [Terriglobales bacterium]